jgi:hypothetical protein
LLGLWKKRPARVALKAVLSCRGPVGPLGPLVSTKGLDGSALDGRPLDSEMPIQEGALLLNTDPRASAHRELVADTSI